MGITIHYTFISKNPMKVNEALKIAKKYAEKHYKVEDYEESGLIQYSWIGFKIEDYEEPKRTINWLKAKYGENPIMLKIKEVKDLRYLQENLIFDVKKPIGAIILGEDFYYWGILWFYEDWLLRKNKWELRGYETKEQGLMINTRTTETFLLSFYKFHDYYICNHFCKTQPFNDDEFLPNLRHHIHFCNLLELVSEYMDHAYIDDEGEYYKTHDVKKLSENFGANARMIWQIASKLQEVSNESFRFEVGGKYDIKKFKKYKKEP